MQSRHLTNRSRNTTGSVSHKVLDWEGKTSELPQYGQFLRPILRTLSLQGNVYAAGRSHKSNTVRTTPCNGGVRPLICAEGALRNVETFAQPACAAIRPVSSPIAG